MVFIAEKSDSPFANGRILVSQKVGRQLLIKAAAHIERPQRLQREVMICRVR